jgi:hypothetical protein
VPANDAVTFARLRSGNGAEIVDLDSSGPSQLGLKEQENGSLLRLAEYLSLSQVPDAKPDGSPPEAAPATERWVAPDQDLIPRAVAEALSEETLPSQNVPVASGNPEKDPVHAGLLRAPRRWERLLVEAAVIGGRERWRTRINGLGQQLRSQLAEIEDENEAKGAVVRRNIEDLQAFADYVLPLIESLDALPDSGTWGEWLDHLWEGEANGRATGHQRTGARRHGRPASARVPGDCAPRAAVRMCATAMASRMPSAPTHTRVSAAAVE